MLAEEDRADAALSDDIDRVASEFGTGAPTGITVCSLTGDEYSISISPGGA